MIKIPETSPVTSSSAHRKDVQELIHTPNPSKFFPESHGEEFGPFQHEMTVLPA